MSTPQADAARFARELDAEWLRQEVGASLPAVDLGIDEDELTRALIAADPLAPGRRYRSGDPRGRSSDPGWLDALADLVGAWPGRLALAGATCALVITGFLGGLVLQRPITGVPPAPVVTPERSIRLADGVTEVPPAPIYSPEGGRRFGVTGTGRASDDKVAEAMVSYGRSDFTRQAVPLLREAISLDPENDRAHFWLGIALLLDHRAAEAVPSLEEASRLASKSAVYKHYLVYAYLATGAVERALSVQTDLLRTP